MKPVSKEQVVEAVQDLMQTRYGFRCEEGKTSASGYTNSDGVVYFHFDAETPTGQASFSQEWVQISIKFWQSFGNEKKEPIPVIDVRVDYYHPSGGHNGYGKGYYVLTEPEKYGGEKAIIKDLVEQRLVELLKNFKKI